MDQLEFTDAHGNVCVMRRFRSIRVHRGRFYPAIRVTGALRAECERAGHPVPDELVGADGLLRLSSCRQIVSAFNLFNL